MAKILIIDDEADLRFVIGEYLRDLGFDVIEAAGGPAGLELVASDSPDAVLCDLRMPEMDGLAVLKILVQNHPELPILVITGAGVLADAVEALRLGAWDFVLKPVKSPDILEHTLARALERSELRRVKREYQATLEAKVYKGHHELQKSREILNEKCGILEALFQNVPMGLYYLNQDGRFLEINQALAEIFGKSRQEMIDRRLDDFPDIPDLAGLRTPGNIDLQVRRFTIHGKKLELAFQNSVIRSTEKEAIGLVGFVLDVSQPLQAERDGKEKEQQLLQADRLISLGILTAGVAHEINNPTQVIMSSTPVVRKAWESILPILDRHAGENGDFSVAGLPYSRIKEKLGDLLAAIEDGAERIKAIVHNMKDFARLDPEDQRELLDINSALQVALKLVDGKLKKSCRNLHLRFAENLPPVKANGRQLEQVFINLLVNAAEALSSPEESITIKTVFEPQSDRILITIKDEGAGIPPELMKNIFDPFFTTKRDIGGTGLGLSISNRVIQKHGGSIFFESREGEGTTATICLPRGKEKNS